MSDIENDLVSVYPGGTLVHADPNGLPSPYGDGVLLSQSGAHPNVYRVMPTTFEGLNTSTPGGQGPNV